MSNEYNIKELAANLSKDQFRELVTYWTHHNGASLTHQEAYNIQFAFNTMLMQGHYNEIAKWKEHASAAENAASTALYNSRSKNLLEKCKYFIDKFHNRSFNKWDWFYERLNNNTKA